MMEFHYFRLSQISRGAFTRTGYRVLLLGILALGGLSWGENEANDKTAVPPTVGSAATAAPTEDKATPDETGATVEEAAEEVSEECSAAGIAFMKGVTFLEHEEPTSVEDAFIISHLLSYAKREGLEKFVEKARDKFKDDPSIWYLTAGSPRITIPDPLPKGEELLKLITNTPHADPPRKSFDLIIDFFTTPHDGYLLTHQVYMLEIAKSRKIELPDTIYPDGSQFMGKIWLEQQDAKEFTDLCARRIFILLLYSMPAEEDATKLLKHLLAAQKEDGSWRDEKSYSYELGGESFTRKATPVQTTAYATFAISAYLRRICEEQEVIKVD